MEDISVPQVTTCPATASVVLDKVIEPKTAAVVLHRTEGWRVTGTDLMELGPVILPAKLAEGMVEMQLLKCGICGSDLNYYHKGDKCILGHEATARVVRCAEDVSRLKPGDLVAVEPARPCGKCVECEDGRYHTCRQTRYMATPPEDGCLSRLFQWPAKWCHRIRKLCTTGCAWPLLRSRWPPVCKRFRCASGLCHIARGTANSRPSSVVARWRWESLHSARLSRWTTG